MQTEMTIGEFSRVSHLSVKTLRHYHDVGLLDPDSVNPSNGYRYYSADQVATAQVIRRLRDLEMPVTDVKALLSTDDAAARNALIAQHLERLEDDLARTREAVSSLRNLLERPQTPLRVEHRTVPATPAVAISDTVSRESLVTWWRGALGELHAMVEARDVEAAGPSGGLYASEIFQLDRGEAAVYIPVSADVRPIGRVQQLVVPAAELAVVTHHGPLDDLDLTYGALGAYATRHELSIDAPLRETYVRDAFDTPDQTAWKTEIGWPILRADADA
jgi:DNA-binding transcriptional MerR regulator